MRHLITKWWHDIFSYPKKELQETHEDYDAYWRTRRGQTVVLSLWQQKRAVLIEEKLALRNERAFTIADIGCGDGAILVHVLKRFPDARAIGYDSSSVAHELARQAGVHETKFLDLKNDTDLISVEAADYLLFLETLEHLAESEKVLRAALKKARKGVFISFPNSGFFTYRLRLLFGKFPAQWARVPNEHLRFWTLGDTTWWLQALGIQNAHVQTYEGVPVLRNILPGLFAAGILIFIPSDK